MMEGFVQKVNHVFSGGDPTVMQWFLIRETYLPFLLSGCYVLFCTVIGPAIMSKRKPFDLRRYMIIYNFAMAAYYIGAITVTAIYIPNVTWEEFCIRGTVREGDYTYTLAYTAWVTYLIKYVEYLDTVFFVLRKKMNQMSFLHVFHHTVVPLTGWALIRTVPNGMLCVPAILNGFIHVIMYTYYGLAAMGPQVQKYLGWKKYLTQLQMTQFVLIFLFVVMMPLTGCKIIKLGYNLNATLTPFFFYLFYKFYQNTFQQKKD